MNAVARWYALLEAGLCGYWIAQNNAGWAVISAVVAVGLCVAGAD